MNPVEIDLTIDRAIRPLEAFQEILRDLSCSTSLEADGEYLYQLSIIYDLICENVEKETNRFRHLNCSNETEPKDTAKRANT